VTIAWEGAIDYPWSARTAAALRALLELFAIEVEVARMAVVEITALGEEARVRYRDVADRFVVFVDEGRETSVQARELPFDTARVRDRWGPLL
jgi:predicted MarR family transcription regulator